MKKKQSYLYARVSSRPQDTLSQWPQLREWAEVNELVDFIEVEDVGTGRNMSRRGIQSIIKAVSQGAAKQIVVVSINRLGRSTRQVLEVIELCGEHGVTIHSIREHVDTSTPMGKMMITMLVALAELENEQRSAATKAGIAAKKAQCKKDGVPYPSGGSAKGYSTAVTKDKADAIFAMHEQGKSYRAIAKVVGLSDKTVRTVILEPRPFYADRKAHALYRKMKKRA